MTRPPGEQPAPAEPGVRDWRNFAAVYRRLGPPLRPSPSDVANLRRAIAGREGRVLLLGVTPELAALGADLTAADNSPRMLATVWPGDSAERRAMLADWTALPFAEASFDAAIGDGSLNSAPEVVDEVLREIRRVLGPGGRAAFRTFCSPEQPETLDAIRADVTTGWGGNFHALKWRIAMALAAEEPEAVVPVRKILATFEALFPDREALAGGTGWSADEIGTIDAYRNADHSLGFPTLSRLRERAAALFDGFEVLPGSGYPLAERCPTIVWSVGEGAAVP